jgi:hypothetical protein
MTKGTYNYNKLVSYCNDNQIILLKDYKDINVTRDTFILGKCNTSNCTNEFNKTFRQLKATGSHCIFCTKNNMKIKVENTCLKKYGVKSVFQCKEMRDNMTKNIIDKYGVNNVSKLKEIQLKKENTCMKNHGVKVSFNSSKIKQQITNTYIEKYGVDNPFKSDIIKNQIKQTNLQKYGVENPQQNKIIKNKTENTCLDKYGVENVLQLERVIQKRNQICLEKYGDKIVLRTELGKQTVKKTCLEKYGVENPQQVPEIAEKASKNSYRKKTYILPSGKELICQGYEPLALDKLIKEYNVLEDDILTGCKNVPQIWYNDGNGKKHRHYVDIFIPSQNRCIEVKSTWTAEKKKDNIYLKQNAAKELGYNYEIWIYNYKKELVEVKI